MAGPLPYFKHWQKDYLSSATLSRLSLAGHGLLFLLQNFQWEDGALPDDETALRKMVRADRKEFAGAWREVRPLLVADENAMLVYPPLAAQRVETLGKVERLTDNANKGGAPRGEPSEKQVITRWISRLYPGEKLNQNQNHIQRYNPTPSGTEGSPGSPPAGKRVAFDEEKFEAWFLEFQRAYPQRKGNYGWPKAKSKLDTLFRQGLSGKRVMDGLLRFAAHVEATGRLGTPYVPMASTWVNGKGWDDDYPPALTVVPGGGSPAPAEDHGGRDGEDDALRALHMIEAERAAIGSMLLSKSAHDAVRETLVPDDFHNPACRTVFEAIWRRECGPQGFDFPDLIHALGDAAVAGLPGGADFLLDLENEVPSAANHERYASVVAELGYLRRTFGWARDLARTVQSEEATVEDVRAFMSVPPDVPLASASPLIHLSEIDAEGGDTGVPTGFSQLDHAISTHGYPDGQMTVVRAYHKGGKSTFMVSSYVAAARAGRRVLYATFADLSGKQVKRRVMRNLTGWSKKPQMDILTQIEYDKCLERIGIEWDSYLYDGSKSERGNEVEAFGAWLRSHHRKKPFDLVFLDYAQKLRIGGGRRLSRLEEAEECSNYVSRLAARLEIPIVVGSQITEGREGEKAITKGSRAWEEDAGWVLSLSRENPDADGNADVKCDVTYSRFGVQDRETVLRWNAERLRIETVNA